MVTLEYYVIPPLLPARFYSSDGWRLRPCIPVVVGSDALDRYPTPIYWAADCWLKVEVIEKCLVCPSLLARLVHQQGVRANSAIAASIEDSRAIPVIDIMAFRHFD